MRVLEAIELAVVMVFWNKCLRCEYDIGPVRRLTLRRLERSNITLKLVEGLHVFLLFNTIENNPAPRLKVRNTILKCHSTNCNTRVHLIFCKVEPPYSASVYATTFSFQSKNQLNSFDFGGTGYSAGREDRTECIEAAEDSGSARGCAASRHAPSFAFSQHSTDHAGQMDDVTKLFHLHQFIDFDSAGLAGAINVVSGQIDKHDMLGTILGRIGQLRAELFVLCDKARL